MKSYQKNFLKIVTFLSVTLVAATLVLPRNMFATYESPIGGWSGPISLIWNDPAPNGRGFFTEGNYQ